RAGSGLRPSDRRATRTSDARRRSSRDRAVDEVVEADHAPAAAELDELNVALVTGLETNRLPRGNVQAHAARRLGVELERGVDVVEVEVRADLDRPVAGVAHR